MSTSIEWTDATWNPTRGCTTGVRAARRHPGEVAARRHSWRYGALGDMVRHPPTIPAQMMDSARPPRRASPSARRRSRRRTAGGGRRNVGPRGAGCAKRLMPPNRSTRKSSPGAPRHDSTEPISPLPTPADCPWLGGGVHSCLRACQSCSARSRLDSALRFGGRRSHALQRLPGLVEQFLQLGRRVLADALTGLIRS
jgi:hypothetical protein